MVTVFQVSLFVSKWHLTVAWNVILELLGSLGSSKLKSPIPDNILHDHL